MFELNPAEFLDEFRAEANEHLEAIDAQLLKLERDPANLRPIREMFLSAHTIKGGAAMLGLMTLRDLAHAAEDVLARLRDQHRALDRPTADLLFQALDRLRTLVATSAPGEAEPDPQTVGLVAELQARAAKLEAATPDGAPAPTPLASAPMAPAVSPAPELRRRALLVEESATVRMLERMLLEEVGLEVDALGDGQEAFERALRTAYDLVVTGVENRTVRGPELAGMLRSLGAYARVPIVVMSADDNPAQRALAAEAGVNAYIRKGSFGERRLVDMVRQLVGDQSLTVHHL